MTINAADEHGEFPAKTTSLCRFEAPASPDIVRHLWRSQVQTELSHQSLHAFRSNTIFLNFFDCLLRLGFGFAVASLRLREAKGQIDHFMAESKRRNRARTKPKNLEARYTNYFEVGHNAFEFIFDFGQYHPENTEARMHTRIVTGPVYAKLMADLLQDAVKRFEEEHGTIQPVDDEFDPIAIVQQSIAGYDHRFNSLRIEMGEPSDNVGEKAS